MAAARKGSMSANTLESVVDSEIFTLREATAISSRR
jgi:hypothetical protein